MIHTLERRTLLSLADLDPTFGDNSRTAGDEWSFDSMTTQPDGKIVAAGIKTTGTQTGIVARFTADGQPDATFGNNGIVMLQPTQYAGKQLSIQVAVLSDGDIIATDFDSSGNLASIIRLNSSGQVDSTFANAGRLVTSATFEQPLTLAATANGGFLIGGTSATAAGHLAVASYQSDGQLVSGFGTAGVAATDLLFENINQTPTRVMAVQSNGAIVLAGLTGNASPMSTLLRLTAGGAADSSFGNAGYATLDFITGKPEKFTSVTIRADSTILASGFAGEDGNLSSYLAAFSTTGVHTSEFGGDGVIELHAFGSNSVSNRSRSIMTSSDGTIWLSLDTYSTYLFSAAGELQTVEFIQGSVGGVEPILQGNKLLTTGGAIQRHGNDAIIYNAQSRLLQINGSSGSDTIMIGQGDEFTDYSYNGLRTLRDRSYVGAIEIYGGDGNDSISVSETYSSSLFADGQGGNDRLVLNGSVRTTLVARGGDGNDSIVCSAQIQGGSIRLSGGLRNDFIDARDNQGAVRIYGEGGKDTLFGSDGNDYLSGDGGNDSIRGYAGNDRLYGGGGEDNLDGGQQRDRVFGEVGNDTLMGGSGSGVDTLDGGVGTDALHGGGGFDMFFLADGFNDVAWGDSDSARAVNHDDGLDELLGVQV